MKKRIGITGGVGSGKSVVMDYLQACYGAKIILADLVAHDLMQPGAISYQQIIDHFGKDILKEDGEIDRQKLGAIVFADEEELKILNEITHPNVKEEIRARIHMAIEDENVPFVCLEAALLLEENYREMLDEIWYIYVDRQTRIERLAKGRGYTEEKSLSIMEKQLSDDYFMEQCEHTIDNSHSVEETQRQIDTLLRSDFMKVED